MMKSPLIIFSMILGLALCALDKVLVKQRLIEFDKYLARFVVLNWKKFLLLIFALPIPFLFYQAVSVTPSFAHLAIAGTIFVGMLIIGAFSWIVLGGLLAYSESRRNPNRAVPSWFILAFAVSTPLLMVGFFLITLARLFLHSLIFPFKGIRILNRKSFNSFYGVLGVVLIIISVIQFSQSAILHLQINKNLITVLDWIGSVLMLGSIWGWLYSRISRPIKKRLVASDRRLKAMLRALSIKYGKGIEDTDDPNVKDPVMKRYRSYRSRLVNAQMPLLKRAYILASNTAQIEGDHSANLVSPRDYEEVQQYKQDRNQIMLLYLRIGLNVLLQASRHSLIKIVDGVTYSVFSGTVGAIIFLLGFALWNLSKILSLYTP